ncbi:MAG: hypothetical protein ACOYT7_02990 [Patescibacteria group bacterium]
MHAVRKGTKWGIPLLVIAAMLIATVPAAADDDYYWEAYSYDASCEFLAGFVDVYLEFDGEPAAGVPVTFTWHGDDYGPYYSNDEGWIYSYWAYTPGEGEVTVGITAEDWGYTEASFSGPDDCGEVPTPSVEVSWPCGQEVPSVTLGWTGEIDGTHAWIWNEPYNDYQEDWSEGNSVTFEVYPGATYYYFTEWWVEWDGEGGWGFTEGYFTAPEECILPPPPEVRNNQYWLVDIYNPVPYDGWLDYCFAIMPQGYIPTDEWRGQPDHCGWTDGRVVAQDWVYLDAAGNPHYDGPGWLPEYYDPDYVGVYQNLEKWNQEYLESLQ